jgi:serine/threonine protein kinase/tetratricopeptide (TPR) repeat protein
MIGRTLGHYRIEGKIGEGGMGVVYRARDERLDRDVALKVLPTGTLADEGARKRFRKEALALAKLNHPDVEAVYDFDTQDGVDFLAMEYIPGVTLSDKLAAGPLPEKEVVRLGSQLAEGLGAAHEQNIVHRDLKPGNLRIMADGRLKILDFGLAKLVRPDSDAAVTESVTETKAGAGTLPYMAPEQLQGAAVDARTDIYATGCVLYEMATGRLPFQDRLSTALADAILHRPTPPPGRLKPDLSPRLEEIILKCLEKEPGSRYQSSRELLVDLRRLGAPTVEFSPRRGPRVSAWLWRRTAWGAGIVVVVLLAVLFGLNVGGLRERLLERAGAGQISSLAVLPLENLSHDPEQEYFVDGMTEALITDLSKISALRVISRTSVMQYKGKHKPLPEIARELMVDAVVEGSVLRAGERVRITAQLIRAVPEQHLWANSYDRELRDVLAVHSEVARAIANEIRVTLTPQESARLTSTRAVVPEAHEAYLKGRYYWNKRTKEGLRRGLEFFQQAIEKDPNYAAGYAGLADYYNVLPFYASVSPTEAYPKARTAALKALELDDMLGEAHASLAYVLYRFDWDWAGADREFKRALALNPSNATVHHWYGTYLAGLGRMDEALAELERARKLDPYSLIINRDSGLLLFYARRYDEAIEQLQKALDLDPSFDMAQYVLGRVYAQKARYPEAVARCEKSASQSGRSSNILAALGFVYAQAGRRTEAQKILKELQRRSETTYVSGVRFAWIHVSLGEKERALAWLEKAFSDRDPEMGWIRVEPWLDPLRTDPRFQDLVRRMNFPQ